MKFIEEAWTRYREICLPGDMPPAEVTRLQEAFKAGAATLFATVMELMDPGTEPTEKDLKVMYFVQGEVDDIGRALDQRLLGFTLEALRAATGKKPKDKPIPKPHVHRPQFLDLKNLSENARFEMIGKAASSGEFVACLVEASEPGKAERYIKRITERYPACRLVDRIENTPTPGIITLRFGPKAAH